MQPSIKIPWDKRNPEKVAAIKRAYYDRNKEAAKQRAIEWNRLHKERRAEINKKYSVRNRAKLTKKALAWQTKNKAMLAARSKIKRAANPVEANRARRLWRRLNPDKTLAAKHRRRARERLSVIGPEESILRYIRSVKSRRFATCHYCRKRVPARRIQFDHVIPLSKGGSHSVGNLCVACIQCNSSKGAKLLSEWSSSNQVFLAI